MMGMSEAWRSTYDEEYINEFQPEANQKTAQIKHTSLYGPFLIWSQNQEDLMHGKIHSQEN